MTDANPATTYSSYLALDEVLGAQRPRSDEHDEMLFIVIHQVYELWFKQMLHELAYLQRRLEEGHSAHSLRTLRRVLQILKVAVAQIDVLETMTPRQFTSFRTRLDAASGFQSGQFREFEAVLGRRDAKVFGHYPEGSRAREQIAAAMSRPSVYDSFLCYLRLHDYPTPTRHDFSEPGVPSDEVRAILLRVYADDGMPALVCEQLVDLDEGVQEWRYRHVKMVERTIGDKSGTGGSPGAKYLRSTLFAPMFPDLWAVRGDL